MKVCMNGLVHMTKMNQTPIYGKKPIIIFSSRTKSPTIVERGIQHRGRKLYIVCIVDDPRLVDFNLFYGNVKLGSLFFHWKTVIKSFNGRKCAENDRFDQSYVYEKDLTQGSCQPLPRGYIHMYMYMTIIFKKILLRSR